MRVAARRTRIGRAAFLAAGALGLLVAAGASHAEVRRIEEVGVVPLAGRTAGAGAARDAAKQAGLHAAVERVARSFLLEEPRGGEDVDLDEVLGKRMVPYTTRFRVLEDQGERPAMYPRKGVTNEYVVVVEVFVDADRVRQRLIDAGVLEQDPLAGEFSHVQLELRGIDDYAALTAVRELLTERLGAVTAVPRSFRRGVAVLDVELEGGGADAALLAKQMATLGAPGLGFRSLGGDAQLAVLGVTWTPPPADAPGR